MKAKLECEEDDIELLEPIVFDVNRHCGSIFLADAMNASGILKCGGVFFKNLGTERALSAGIVEDRLRNTNVSRARTGIPSQPLYSEIGKPLADAGRGFYGSAVRYFR